MVTFNPARAFRPPNTSLSFRGFEIYTLEEIVEKGYNADDIAVTAEIHWICLFFFPIAIIILVADVLATRSRTSLSYRIETVREQQKALKQLEDEL